MAVDTVGDSKHAEKDYLRRSGGGDWEASKPFPPPGQTASEEHAQLVMDFAVLLRILAPTASDLVLDLGAGSCWVSDWLRRCGMRTVAVDISMDMLRLGARRLGSPQGLAVGDMEHLPFADDSFRKACCLNAFHHVPNAVDALREIRRVMAPDGVVFFSEPGLGHAANPTSVAASRNYGVLEKEIVIQEFMNSCFEAGFADVRLHPICHVIPLFELDGAQWRDWTRFTASKRPFRALEKLWRAVLEVGGFGKKSVLFEEAFAIRLLRELQPTIEQHPVLTAHRRPFVKPEKVIDQAELEMTAAPPTAAAGTQISMRVRIVNTGTTAWNMPAPRAQVRLGVQLLSNDGSVINRDYSRHELPASMLPGGRCDLTLRIPLPDPPGRYQLKLDLVREGVHWFELTGSRPMVHAIELT